MPALYLFNRRTLLAGDDLQLPSIAWGSVSAVQLFILLPYLLYYNIELLLTPSPSSSDDYYDDIYIDNTNNNLNYDDYFETLLKPHNYMQSNACSNATSSYTNYIFPILLLIYQIGISILTSISIYYEQSIYAISCIGTPTLQIQQRNSQLKSLIEFKLTWLNGYNTLLLVYGLILGCVALLGSYTNLYMKCYPTSWWIVWLTLLIIQFGQCFVNYTTLFALLWRVKPSTTTSLSLDQQSTDFYQRHLDQHHNHHHNNIDVAEELWQNRCEGCCRLLAISTCFMFGGRGIVSHSNTTSGEDSGGGGGGDKFYGDIARALADYFADFNDGSGGGGEEGSTGLDVVPSDVGLGFVLLRHIQAQRKMLARRDALQQQQQQQQVGNDQDSGGYGSRSSSYTDLYGLRNATTTNIPQFPSTLSPNRTTLLFRKSTQVHLPPQGLDGGSSTQPNPAQDNDEAYSSYSRKVLCSSNNTDDYTLLEEGARFARHQLAIYTWILYYYQYPVSGTFRLIGRSIKARIKCSSSGTSTAIQDSSRRGSNSSYEPCSLDIESDGHNITNNNGSSSSSARLELEQEVINGDNFLHIHEATMLAHAGLEKADVAYANFEAGFYETPYCIIIDRKWKSIVLSIRGSLTLEDCVVDVLLDPCPLDALGEKYGFAGAGQHCHGGVLECTNWLHEDLLRHKVLHSLLLGDDAKYPDYTLRIVGHSLGAGIGVILSYMLRNTFPTLRCICYSPPGGLLSWELAKECSEFVNSFVLDSDIVPRLSINNMECLRDEVLHLIARVKLSKYEIAQRIFKHGACGEVESLGDLDYLIQQNEDMLYAPDAVPDSEFLTQLRRFESMQQERRSNRGMIRSVNLYPPGNITHLVKTGQSNQCLHGLVGCITCGASNSGSIYTPIQKENDDFNEIEISPTLWTDHFPNRVCAEIEKVAESFGIDTTLGS